MFRSFTIAIVLLFTSQAIAELSYKEQQVFDKLPEDTKLIMILSSEDKCDMYYAKIKRSIMDINYAECYDFEHNITIFVFSDEPCIAQYFIYGQEI